jgi:DNA-binding transcriptional LysR family regulator
MSISTPELRQLRHFIAVAERLHFGQAAAAVGISQPPLSRSIQDLERRVGVRLLHRARRHVELTSEGAAFLQEAKRIVGLLETAVLQLQKMAAGESGRLTVGFIPLADYGVLPSLLKAFKASHAKITLALREMISPEQIIALRSKELDIGLVIPPVSAREFEHLVLQQEQFVVALPAGHQLARRRGALPVRQFASEPFVQVPRERSPGLHDKISRLTAAAGFVPHVAQEAIQMQTVVSLVSSGLGVALVPASVANLGRQGVVYRPLSDAHDPLEIWLVWRRGHLGFAASSFVAHARRLTRGKRTQVAHNERTRIS